MSEITPEDEILYALLNDPLRPNTPDEAFMAKAIAEARLAFKAGEVPVGAVVVQGDRIIARGRNQVEALQDATAHAEMIAITAASVALQNWRLMHTVLYTTVEPCAMCLGAALLARVEKIVWGAPDIRHGANGSWVDLLEKPHPTHRIEVVKGVYGDLAGALMRAFFQQRRAK